ncbi:mucin-21-like isoform X3 [Hemibagrus wyckioides]|uniref:mucin-21-like isoform X3 n=1 Tax=Hemibagrus wyckioides TaxID=337641 RepID=UPI00266B40A3|nr:mucin-21-like isoform X3 [Hemibagrus wyckioides]
MDWKLVLTVLCMTVTNTSTTNTTSVAAVFNLVFSINETFDPALANSSSPEFAAKATNVLNAFEPICRTIFSNLIRMNIHGFSKGSIVTNSSLEFSANGTIPTNSTLQNILVNVTKSNSSLNIIPSSINVTQIPVTTNSTTNMTPSMSMNTTSTNSTLTNSTSTNSPSTNSTSTNSTSTNSPSTNSTSTNSTSTNSTLTNTSSTLSMATNTSTTKTSSVAAVFNLVFSINETFDPALANSSSPEFAAKSTSIRNRFEPIYRQNCSNFLQMIIHGYSKGSIVTNSSLEFSANGTIPTNSTLQNILVNVTKSNSSLNIIPSSINVTQIPVTTNSTTNMTPSMSMNTTSTNSTLTNSSSKNSSSTNSTSTNSTLTNSSSTNSSSTNSSSTNSTSTNSTSTNSTLTNSPSTNSTLTNSTFTNSTSTNSTLTNTSSTLSMATNTSTTNTSSTPSTNSTSTNTTSTNSTLTNTSSTLSMATNTSTTKTSSVAAVFNLVFSINETFDPALANSSSPEFAAKSTIIRNRFEPIYRQNCSNFLQMIIHGYSKGSIVTNSSLEFSANGTIPTNSTLQNILVNATKSNSSLNIIPSSINVTQIPVTNYWTTNTSLTMSTTNIPPTPENASAVFNLTFSISETFDSALASTCSPQFGAKAANIRNQVEPLYKKAFKNFILMQILRFKNGSIIAESKLYMDPSGSNVTATQVKDVFLNGIAIFNFNVDPASIRVTQIGNSMPPVIASSVSMICMSLLSLLLSLTLHF